jgi:phage gpG-like protein
MDVKIIDNTKAIEEEMERKIKVVLSALGETAEGYAKDGCPFDTGRLRNSITHREDKTTTYIGTNVEYAETNELNHPEKRHFLRNAVADHIDEYNALAKKLLK